MSVILLRLEGPMQSWGIGSKFTDRLTEAEPSKSGVIGVICCALGRRRDEKIDDLTELKMAIRVEREGSIFYDYHTTLNVLRASAEGEVTKSKLSTVLSRRFYIADACFLVGLEGENINLLEQISHALNFPKWPLFLGRKSFPVTSPVLLTKRPIPEPLLETMKKYPWQGRKGKRSPESLRLIYDCGLSEGESRMDVPLSFGSREFISRNVFTEYISTELLTQED
ncbi:hypothetical protein LCGC14_0493000 [marine sediment metagenome]|uniref:Type I-E CRISPR-associated protein Cas5/CasD n=1 Tax=marine sediment metagenome TaxID=412755 RepID=A0A0F9SPF6_9ZZZZ|nr:type I-E CRISPR-associated protein Cas5/CasD [archaeon]HEC40113.1 type I-E CRISPR-associated protein Cas5/CasD [bacterium]